MMVTVSEQWYMYGWMFLDPPPKSNVLNYNSWALGHKDHKSMLAPTWGPFKLDYTQQVDDTVLVNYPPAAPIREENPDSGELLALPAVAAESEQAALSRKSGREYFIEQTGCSPEDWLRLQDEGQESPVTPKDDEGNDIPKELITQAALSLIET